MTGKLYKIVSTHVLLAILVLALTPYTSADLPTRFCNEALGQSNDVTNWCVKWSEMYVQDVYKRINVILLCCLGGRDDAPYHTNYYRKLDPEYVKAISLARSSDHLMMMALHLSACYKERSTITYREFEVWSKNPNPSMCDPSGTRKDYGKNPV